MELLRIFLTIACLFELIVDQINIVGAYLKIPLGGNDVPIFMKLPPEMEMFKSIRAGLVYRLLHSIYGVKQ